MGVTDGTIHKYISKVPSFYWDNVGFVVTGTSTVQLCLLDIRGVTHLHCLIENVSADGAANRLDWGVIAYLDIGSTPDAQSAKTVIAADTAIATTAVDEFIIGVNMMDTTNETPVDPNIHEILPAAQLQVNVDAQGADNITANIWMVGVMQ